MTTRPPNSAIQAAIALAALHHPADIAALAARYRVAPDAVLACSRRLAAATTRRGAWL